MAITTAPGAITVATRLIGLPPKYALITQDPAATVTSTKVPRNSMISRIHSGHARSTPDPSAFSRCHGSGCRVSSQEDARMVDLGADGEPDTR